MNTMLGFDVSEAVDSGSDAKLQSQSRHSRKSELRFGVFISSPKRPVSDAFVGSYEQVGKGSIGSEAMDVATLAFLMNEFATLGIVDRDETVVIAASGNDILLFR